MVTLGIIGLNNHYHVIPMAALARDGLVEATITGVFDQRDGYAAAFAAEYGIETVYESRDALLADPRIDAVIVMSDTASHHGDVLASVAAGRSVLIDKPLSITEAQGREMVDAADAAGADIMVAFHIRFAPAYLRARQLIDDGVIGTPLSMRIAIRVPLEYVKNSPTDAAPGWYADPALAGGGGFLDHAVHYVDAFRFLLGSEAAAVTAVIGTLAHPDLAVDDYGVAVVTTDANQVVTIESTWHAPGWYAPESSPEECVIVGTSGELVLRYHGEPQLEYVGPSTNGRVREDWHGDERGAIAYRRILEEFIASVAEGRHPSGSTGADGLAATRVIEAAYRASETGTSVVLQPERDK